MACLHGFGSAGYRYGVLLTTGLRSDRLIKLRRSSAVDEPLLQLKWTDAGRRTIFLGKFGEATPAHSLYVTSAELCAPAGRLF